MKKPKLSMRRMRPHRSTVVNPKPVRCWAVVSPTGRFLSAHRTETAARGEIVMMPRANWHTWGVAPGVFEFDPPKSRRTRK